MTDPMTPDAIVLKKISNKKQDNAGIINKKKQKKNKKKTKKTKKKKKYSASCRMMAQLDWT